MKLLRALEGQCRATLVLLPHVGVLPVELGGLSDEMLVRIFGQAMGGGLNLIPEAQEFDVNSGELVRAAAFSMHEVGLCGDDCPECQRSERQPNTVTTNLLAGLERRRSKMREEDGGRKAWVEPEVKERYPSGPGDGGFIGGANRLK